MSKKLAGGINSLIEGNQPRKKMGRPQTITRIPEKSSQEGLGENFTRATFVLDEFLLDKIKSIAFWRRVTIKEVVNEALEIAVAKYEQEHGEIVVPEK